MDGLVAAFVKKAELAYKIGTTHEAIGAPHSHWYANGRPGPGAASSAGAAGETCTTLNGRIPFPASGGSPIHISRWAAAAGQIGTLWLCDRLWQNSGLSATSTSGQSVNSVTLPARDANGATSGEAIMAAVEWSAAGGAGTPNLTLAYTNQAGTGSRATPNLVAQATPQIGTFEIFSLQSGDTGIRSIQTYTASATRTSGTFHLVMFRVLAELVFPIAFAGEVMDPVTGGLPRAYDDSCLFYVFIPSATGAANIYSTVDYAQG